MFCVCVLYAFQLVRWGSGSLWLHVDAANEGAVRLYTDAGYRVARVLQPQSRLAAALAAVPAALMAAVTGRGGGGGAASARGAGPAEAEATATREVQQQQQQQQLPKLRGRQFVMQKPLQRLHGAGRRPPGRAAAPAGRGGAQHSGGVSAVAGSAAPSAGGAAGAGQAAPHEGGANAFQPRPAPLPADAAGAAAAAAEVGLGPVDGSSSAGAADGMPPVPSVQEPQSGSAAQPGACSAGKAYTWRA